jgi:hypothetical protein
MTCALVAITPKRTTNPVPLDTFPLMSATEGSQRATIWAVVSVVPLGLAVTGGETDASVAAGAAAVVDGWALLVAAVAAGSFSAGCGGLACEARRSSAGVFLGGAVELELRANTKAATRTTTKTPPPPKAA